MTALACRLALMDEAGLPAWLTRESERIAAVFGEASGGDIQLTVDGSRLARALKPGTPGVEAYDLHRAAGVVANNRTVPIANIAVLFASRYARADYAKVLGIMFDRGFNTPDDQSGSSDFMAIPREGCAVFLDTIRRLRPSDVDFERESFFTTIHELGHVFNLQHQAGANFMASSAVTAPYDLNYHAFTAAQCQSLARCSTSDAVRPGGSPFGSRAVGGNHDRAGSSDASGFGLGLSIGLATHRFRRFEPVELDIELGVLPGIARSFAVPEQIDPGYERFALWIEDPSGERRRYRSPRRYCAAPATRRIAPGKPYRRDISIFAEAGGYSFAEPGIYRLWAEFRPGRARPLRSNTLEFLVEPSAAGGLDAAAEALLARGDVARLLYHRLLHAAPRGRRDLERFCVEATAWPGIGRVEYSLGRALIHAAGQRIGKAGGDGRGLRRRGLDLLARAQDREGLGQTQRVHVARLLVGA